MIWAFHETVDPTEECFDSASITYHSNKGSQSVNLDTGIPEEVELEDDVMYMDFLMDEVEVPSTDTTYYCKLFEIPFLNDTHHAVKFETIVQEGHEALVHHILVYDCPDEYVEQTHNFTEGECGDVENMPSAQCRSAALRHAWAIGGNDVYLPSNAGMPISGDSDWHYILMEMHYDVKFIISHTQNQFVYF